MKNILVTGAAGFIGFHLSRLLLTLGYKVSGIDNLNDYYEVSLKKSRLEILLEHENFSFHLMDLASDVEMNKFTKKLGKVAVWVEARKLFKRIVK